MHRIGYIIWNGISNNGKSCILTQYCIEVHDMCRITSTRYAFKCPRYIFIKGWNGYLWCVECLFVKNVVPKIDNIPISYRIYTIWSNAFTNQSTKFLWMMYMPQYASRNLLTHLTHIYRVEFYTILVNLVDLRPQTYSCMQTEYVCMSNTAKCYDKSVSWHLCFWSGICPALR